MVPPLSTLKQYQPLLSSVFCETPVEVYSMVKGDNNFSKNNAEVQKWVKTSDILGEIAPRLRREASLQIAGPNDVQGEILFQTDYANVALLSDTSIIKVGTDWFNLRFDLNRPTEQEPLCLYVAEKRSGAPPLL